MNSQKFVASKISHLVTLIFIVQLCSMAIDGCASMDLQLTSLKSDISYGSSKSSITRDQFRYWTDDKVDRPYLKLADLIVQETPKVILSRSTDEMIAYMADIAWENGADALINVQVSTTNAAGGYARISPVVKGTAIRFK